MFYANDTAASTGTLYLYIVDQTGAGSTESVSGGTAAGFGSATHIYATPFTVDNTSTPASRTCPAVGSFTATGLNNGATLTVAGTTSSDPGCANAPPPALVTHAKTITAGPVLVGPNQYTISYQIDVINNNLTGLDSYELDETPHFGAGVVINGATCASSLAAALARLMVWFSSDSRTPLRRPSMIGRIPIFGKSPIQRFSTTETSFLLMISST